MTSAAGLGQLMLSPGRQRASSQRSITWDHAESSGSLWRCSVLLLPVSNESQQSGTKLSPPASKMPARTPKPASAPDALPRSEAEARGRSAPRGDSPSSAWERRRLSRRFVLPISCSVHVESSPAPQGGGGTRLWGEDCLLLLLLLLLSCLCFCSLCCMSRPPNRPHVQYWWCMTAEYTL